MLTDQTTDPLVHYGYQDNLLALAAAISHSAGSELAHLLATLQGWHGEIISSEKGKVVDAALGRREQQPSETSSPSRTGYDTDSWPHNGRQREEIVELGVEGSLAHPLSDSTHLAACIADLATVVRLVIGLNAGWHSLIAFLQTHPAGKTAIAGIRAGLADLEKWAIPDLISDEAGWVPEEPPEPEEFEEVLINPSIQAALRYRRSAHRTLKATLREAGGDFDLKLGVWPPLRPFADSAINALKYNVEFCFITMREILDNNEYSEYLHDTVNLLTNLLMIYAWWFMVLFCERGRGYANKPPIELLEEYLARVQRLANPEPLKLRPRGSHAARIANLTSIREHAREFREVINTTRGKEIVWAHRQLQENLDEADFRENLEIATVANLKRAEYLLLKILGGFVCRALEDNFGERWQKIALGQLALPENWLTYDNRGGKTLAAVLDLQKSLELIEYNWIVFQKVRGVAMPEVGYPDERPLPRLRRIRRLRKLRNQSAHLTRSYDFLEARELMDGMYEIAYTIDPEVAEQIGEIKNEIYDDRDIERYIQYIKEA